MTIPESNIDPNGYDPHGNRLLKEDGSMRDLNDMLNTDGTVKVVIEGDSGDQAEVGTNNALKTETYSGLVGPMKLDASTRAVCFVNYTHCEIHSGSHYLYRSYDSILKAGVKELLIVTPNTTKWSHMTIGFEMLGSTVVAELFEGVSTSDDGTPALVQNRNRNSDNTNTVLIYEDPTVTGGAVAGNLIQSGIFGAGRGSAGGSARDNEEVVLQQNTKYLIRFTEQNLTATSVNYVMDWYEHTDKSIAPHTESSSSSSSSSGSSSSSSSSSP